MKSKDEISFEEECKFCGKKIKTDGNFNYVKFLSKRKNMLVHFCIIEVITHVKVMFHIIKFHLWRGKK